jgi:hypothetical protein
VRIVLAEKCEARTVRYSGSAAEYERRAALGDDTIIIRKPRIVVVHRENMHLRRRQSRRDSAVSAGALAGLVILTGIPGDRSLGPGISIRCRPDIPWLGAAHLCSQAIEERLRAYPSDTNPAFTRAGSSVEEEYPVGMKHAAAQKWFAVETLLNR